MTNFHKIYAFVAAVDDLEAEIISDEDSYTVTCNYKGTDEPSSVAWTVGGSPVSDGITPGTLGASTANERLALPFELSS